MKSDAEVPPDATDGRAEGRRWRCTVWPTNSPDTDAQDEMKELVVVADAGSGWNNSTPRMLRPGSAPLFGDDWDDVSKPAPEGREASAQLLRPAAVPPPSDEVAPTPALGATQEGEEAIGGKLWRAAAKAFPRQRRPCRPTEVPRWPGAWPSAPSPSSSSSSSTCRSSASVAPASCELISATSSTTSSICRRASHMYCRLTCNMCSNSSRSATGTKPPS
mmetsp:Transcript_81099/g.234519  ORF Transcript_81099/g.234519 Transcript_81099/m.234519 type:complete len:219 (+) Transcript_81099:11-667(+)